jgi:hypothetical protein
MQFMSGRKKQNKEQFRFGIGEWYGKSFIHLTIEERRFFALLQHQKKKDRQSQPCPPRLAENPDAVCTKAGGVCSIRVYKLSDNEVTIHVSNLGKLVTTCPYRFNEGEIIFHWVGKTILDCPDSTIVNEVGFLANDKEIMGVSQGNDDVGRIDKVLVNPNKEPISWCALEIQAVYFSGASMKKDFDNIVTYSKDSIPFPVGVRRPDFRSSGPKRLMPQLQIKVPTLRRWGKKMAVVIDRSFYDSIGDMGEIKDLSNSDIAWFVVRYKEEKMKQAILEPDFVIYTTLERTVEGLTGGTPVSLNEFEKRIKNKLKK